MSTVFYQSSDGRWSAIPLEGARHWRLAVEPGHGSLMVEPADAPIPPAISLSRGGEDWSLLAFPDAAVAVNGTALGASLRLLRNQDVIRIRLPDGVACEPAAGAAGSRSRLAYFSTERLAAIAPFPSGRGVVHCARCTVALVPGEPVVFCPGCGVAHHESSAANGRRCWTYVETCGACGEFETRLDAGYRWTPDVV